MKTINIQSIKQLNKFILSISNVSSMDEMTQSIEIILKDLFNIKYIELYIIEKDSNDFNLIFSKGFTNEEKQTNSLNPMEGYPGEVYHSKKIIHITESKPFADNLFNNGEILSQFKTILFLPITDQDQVCGVLVIKDIENDRFDDEEIEILSTICHLSGAFFGKLQNTKLLNQAKKEIVKLSIELQNNNPIPIDFKGRKSTEQGLIHSMDLQAILDTGYLGMPDDILKQKNQYDELQLANLRFRSLISSIQAGIMVEDEHRKVVLVNQHFCNLFSIPVQPDLLIGMNCEEAAEASKTLFKDPESFIDDINLTLANRQIVTGFELQMSNGSSLERDFIPIEDLGKKNFGILWIYRDITKRKRNEKDLLHQSRLLSGTAQAMNYLLTVQDYDEAIRKALKAIGVAAGVDRVYIFENLEDKIADENFFSQKYEWSAPGILPQIDNPAFQRMPFAENFPDWYSSLFSGQTVFGLSKDFQETECRILDCKDVKSVIASPIFVNDKLWGIVGFDDCTIGTEWSTNEISTLKALAGSIGGSISRRIIEDELISARQIAEYAFKTKSEFLATMSHEIRTPMHGVIGMTSLLMQTQLTYDQRDYAETIRVSGELLLNLINDILDFSKIESGKMVLEEQNFDLRLAIEEVIDLLSTTANEKRLGLYYDVDPAIPTTIRGDLTRIRQILVNLTGNALKFTSVGEVVISAKEIGKHNNVSVIEFSVKDTGMGIPPEKVDLLFKPFSQIDASTTRKYGGTGLGLAICSNLVKMMDGNIRVKSEVNRGSEFIFTIKTVNQLVNEPNKTGLQEHKFLKGKNILLVDENPTSIEIKGKLLRGININLLSASSSRMCLNILNNNKNIDLIIIDNDISDMETNSLISSIKRIKGYLDCPILLIYYGNVKENRSDKLTDSILRISKPLKHSQLISYLNKIFSENITSKAHSIIQPPQIQKLNGLYPLNILVAEDNAINQKLITRLFEMLGYDIHLAANGYEAIKTVNNMNIDIIFMDIQMPEMDGIEATRKIIEKWGTKKPLIVAMTANALQNDKEKCLEAGMDDYMSKPLTIDQVSMRMEKWALLCKRT